MRTALLILATLTTIRAQAPNPPDVVQTGTFSAVANGTPIFVGAGGPNGAMVWRLTYFVDGTLITAAQLAIQGASAANSAGCAAASYSTITTAGSSTVEVANPSASGAQGNVGVKTYYPCIRARSDAITGSGGTITYQLAGWKYFFNMPVSATITGNLTPTGVSTAQADAASNTPDLPAVSVGGGAATQGTNRDFAYRFNGSTWDRDFICTNRIAFTLSASGNTEIIPAGASMVIRVCHISFTTTAPENVTVTQGTGTNCGTGTATIAGPYQSIAGLALDFTPAAALRSSTSNAVCLSQAATQTLGGVAIYARF